MASMARESLSPSMKYYEKKVRFTLALLCLFTGPLLGQIQIKSLGPYGGDVRSITMDPVNTDVLYAGTADGQIYKTEDGGNQWVKLDPGIGRRKLVIDDLHIDPRDPNVIYAGTWALNYDAGGLFKSLDGGKTWSELPIWETSQSITAVALAASNPDIIVVGTLRGVFRSEDAGKNWIRISPANLTNLESIAIDPSDPNIIYAGTWHLGYKTEDAGKNWKLMDRGMIEDSHVFTISIDAKNPKTIFAGACSGIYKSNSAALQWEKLKHGLTYDDRRTRASKIDPSDSNLIYIGTTRGLFKSIDAGNSWKRTTEKDLVVNAIVVNPKETNIVYLATENAGILKSTSSGTHFKPTNNGFVHRSIACIQADPNLKGRLYAGVVFGRANGGVFRSENSGETWRSASKGLPESERDVFTLLISAKDHDVLYAGTNNGIYKSTNAGETWSKMPSGEMHTKVYDVKFASQTEKELFAATEHGLYKFSSSLGKFIKVPIPGYSGKISALALPKDNPLLVYAAGDKGLYKSENKGKTWTPLQPIESVIRTIELDPEDSNLIYVGTSRGLYHSEDGGNTWMKLRQGAYQVEISKILINPNNPTEIWTGDLALGTILFSKDQGKTWVELDNGRNSGIWSLTSDPFDDGRIFAGTISDGMYLISTVARQGG